MRWFWAVVGVVLAAALLLVPRAPAVSSEMGQSPRAYAPLVVAETALSGRVLGLTEPLTETTPTEFPASILSNSSVFSRADGSGVQVMGEIQNNTDEWLAAAFTITLYHDDRVVLRDTIGSNALPPRGTGCFSKTLPTYADVSHRYDFTFREHIVIGPGLRHIPSSIEAVYGPPRVNIRGTLRNDTGARLTVGTIFARLYDPNGVVIACGHQSWNQWPHGEERRVSVVFEEGVERASYNDAASYYFYTVADTD